MSRLDSIRTAVGAHVTAQVSGVTLSADPMSFESLKKEDYPHALILFEEESPERLSFKQQRRRVAGEITLAIRGETDTRETMDAHIEAIRDAIFADEYLGATVDDLTAEAGLTISNPEDRVIYGRLDIATEEVF